MRGYKIFKDTNKISSNTKYVFKRKSSKAQAKEDKFAPLFKYASPQDAAKIRAAIDTIHPKVQDELLKEVSGIYISASSNEIEDAGGMYASTTTKL